MEFGPEIQAYNAHFRRILGAVANYTYKSLKDAGVDVLPSGAGFYLFPNFEICRAKLAEKGVKTGQDFCDLLFEEQRIAVSLTVTILKIRKCTKSITKSFFTC